MDHDYQDDSQDGRDDGGGHVVHHGSGAQATTRFGIQASESCVQKQKRVVQCLTVWLRYVIRWTCLLEISFRHSTGYSQAPSADCGIIVDPVHDV